MSSESSDDHQPQEMDHLDDYAQNIERILQMHDVVEVIREDGTIVKLK